MSGKASIASVRNIPFVPIAGEGDALNVATFCQFFHEFVAISVGQVYVPKKQTEWLLPAHPNGLCSRRNRDDFITGFSRNTIAVTLRMSAWSSTKRSRFDMLGSPTF